LVALAHLYRGVFSFLYNMVIISGYFWSGNSVSFWTG
jgi:hypothetical protein